MNGKRITAMLAAIASVTALGAGTAFAGETAVRGDVNGDGKFTIADVSTFAAWTMGKSGAVIANEEAADLCKDGRLDAYDLCELRKELLKLTVPAFSELSAMTSDEALELLKDRSHEELEAAWGSPAWYFYGDCWTDGETDVYIQSENRDGIWYPYKVTVTQRNHDVPSISEIAAMTEEDALEAMKGFSFTDIMGKWGGMSDSFSGLFGGGWQDGDSEVSISFTEEKETGIWYPDHVFLKN